MASQASTCSAENCNRQIIARGFCTKHYQQFNKRGVVNGPRLRRKTRAFLEDIPATDRCVIWPFGKSGGGYGVAKYGGKSTSAHRISLIIHVGPPPSNEMEAGHDPILCNNKLCINPRHLRWVSRRENENDKIIAGTRTRGVKASTSNLTEANVLIVFRSNEPVKQAAERLSVHTETIKRIRSGATWGWLTLAPEINLADQRLPRNQR